jgi:hypothetical protein
MKLTVTEGMKKYTVEIKFDDGRTYRNTAYAWDEESAKDMARLACRMATVHHAQYSGKILSIKAEVEHEL